MSDLARNSDRRQRCLAGLNYYVVTLRASRRRGSPDATGFGVGERDVTGDWNWRFLDEPFSLPQISNSYSNDNRMRLLLRRYCHRLVFAGGFHGLYEVEANSGLNDISSHAWLRW